MRILTYLGAHGATVGVERNGFVQPITATSLLEVIRGAEVTPSGDPVPLADVTILAPYRPGKIIGIGLNYPDHAAETGKKVPERPILFGKLTTSVTGPGGPVRLPRYSTMVDFEGELAVVIGRPCRDVTVEDALSAVFGYAIMNDVSARDIQTIEPQWVRAKGADTFGPWGPWITTADEVGDPQDLRIRTWVSGELMQEASTAEMHFSVAELIAFASESVTLDAGDVIATGTPAGVGVARRPQRFLAGGDTVRIAIDGLGSIEHAVVDPDGERPDGVGADPWGANVD